MALDVTDFGAVGDGATDDHAAIQAALDAAAAAGGDVVLVPGGRYVIRRPLRIRTSDTRLVGEGRGVTQITMNDGGPHVAIGPEQPPMPLAVGITASGGSAMRLDPSEQHYLNLRDSLFAELDTLSELCVEFFFQPDAGNSDGALIGSCGQRFDEGPEDQCFELWLGGQNNSLAARLNCGGTHYQIGTPPAPFIVGTPNHIALDYDGATLRLFVNGVMAASTPASGPVSQEPHETIWLGNKIQQWPEYSGVATACPQGAIDSVRISRTSRYTTNFVTPTTKLAGDGMTLCLLNFDVAYGMFTQSIADAAFITWHLVRRDMQGGAIISNVGVSDLTLVGGSRGAGILAWGTVQSIYQRVETYLCRCGINLRNNCFLTSVTECRISCHERAPFAVANLNASGVNIFQNITIEGGQYGLVATAGTLLASNVYVNASRRAAILVSGAYVPFAAFSFINCVISDEGAAPKNEAGLLLTGTKAFHWMSGQIEQSKFDIPLVLCYKAQHAVFDSTGFVSSGSGSAPLFKILAGTPANQIRVRRPGAFPTSKPLFDLSGHVVFDTDEYCGQLAVVGSATTATLVLSAAQPDTNYRVAVTPVVVTPSAASGSWRVKSVTKVLTGLTVEVEAAPGGQDRVVFDVLVKRG